MSFEKNQTERASTYLEITFFSRTWRWTGWAATWLVCAVPLGVALVVVKFAS